MKLKKNVTYSLDLTEGQVESLIKLIEHDNRNVPKAEADGLEQVLEVLHEYTEA